MRFAADVCYGFRYVCVVGFVSLKMIKGNNVILILVVIDHSDRWWSCLICYMVAMINFNHSFVFCSRGLSLSDLKLGNVVGPSI